MVDGGRLVSIVTGLEAPVEAEGPAPSVSIEPTRVVSPMMAPPTVRPAPAPGEADPAPARDTIQRTL
jgi:hypothetical protein